LTEDNPLLVTTDDVDSLAPVLIDKIDQAAPSARSVPIPPPAWVSSKSEIAVLARKGRTLRSVWMSTRHTLDLARWGAAVSELRKVLRMAKSEFVVNHLSAIDRNKEHVKDNLFTGFL